MTLVLRTANYPASLAGCSMAYQAHLPRVEPAAYLLRTVLDVCFRHTLPAEESG
jgi:hypothetical protein